MFSLGGSIAQASGRGPKAAGRPILMLHSSNEPGELSQWQCYDDSNINIFVFSCYCHNVLTSCVAVYFCFFLTEMAERHDAKAVLRIARGLVHRLQDLIDNK